MAIRPTGLHWNVPTNDPFAKLKFYLEWLDQPRIRLAYYLSVALFAVSIISGGLYFDYEPSGLGSSLFKAQRIERQTWTIYIDDRGPSSYIAVFWYILTYWAVCGLVGLIWRGFGAQLYIKSGRDQSSPIEQYGRWAAIVSADIQAGKIAAGSFDPARLFHNRMVRQIKLVVLIAVISSSVYGGIWYLDRMDYRLLTEDYIEYTDYWTSSVHRINYADVSAVNVTCRGKNKDKLVLYYEIGFAGGKTALVAKFNTPRRFRERLPGHLENWARVDAKVRAGGAEFIYPVFNSILITDRQEFNAGQCIAGLDALVGKAVREQVMALLAKPQTPSGNAVQ